MGVPHVDAGAEADAEDIAAAPVDKVEVEVIGEVGGVEDFEGDLADRAGWFAGAEEQILAAGADWGE